MTEQAMLPDAYDSAWRRGRRAALAGKPRPGWSYGEGNDGYLDGYAWGEGERGAEHHSGHATGHAGAPLPGSALLPSPGGGSRPAELASRNPASAPLRAESESRPFQCPDQDSNLDAL